MIPFAEFGPDRSAFDPAFADVMENVLPKANSYGPFPGFVALSSALPAAPKGTFLAYVDAGQYLLFVGTQTHLYKFNPATLGWTDVSRAALYTGAEDRKWDFAQFGNYVIATNLADDA